MNLNKAMLIGRLGGDPEIRYTNSGSAVANFSIATSESWKDKSGNKQDRTEWHNIVAWGSLASFAENYLRKGMLVYVEGKLQTRDWTDKNNVKHYKTEIVAVVIRFMEKQQDSQPAPQGQSEPAAQDTVQPDDNTVYVEDDIPF